MFEGEKITAYLAAIAAAKNIRHAVICPGSRSAPLALALSRQEGLECLSIVDERSAGYIALGIAQQTELPVILVCTSGTAGLNFASVVSEAYYQKVPLIILTADRPEEWIDQQDGQAIRQQDMYRNHILKSYHFRGEAYHEDDLWYAQRCTNEAIDIAINRKGPVHINIPFREPLYDIAPANQEYMQVIRSTVSDVHPVNSEPLQAAARLAAGKEKVWLLIGQLSWDEELEHLIQKMQGFPNLVIIKESLSNLDIPDGILHANECVALEDERLIPDLVITLGGPIVSKKVKQFIRRHKVKHWHVSEDECYTDTFKSATRQIKCDYYTFVFSLSLALKKAEVSSVFRKYWEKTASDICQKIDAYSEKAKYSDWKALYTIYQYLPDTGILQLGNSTPVRYGQLFSHLCPGMLVYSNRGTSGIDGCLSTAVGAAIVSEQNVIAVIGDLTFQYDANALWNKYLPANLKIIVINNSGGNIFRLIEGSSGVEELEDFFETRIQHDFEKLSAHFGVNYYRVNSIDNLDDAWGDFMAESGKASVLEVHTDPEISEQVFKEFYQSLSGKKD